MNTNLYFNKSLGDFELIGLNTIKLILNNLNKYYVITFLKSNKVLYYNKDLRRYVISMFPVCNHCNSCKHFNKNKLLMYYNIEHIYEVMFCPSFQKGNKRDMSLKFIKYNCINEHGNIANFYSNPIHVSINIINHYSYIKFKKLIKIANTNLNKPINVNYFIGKYPLISDMYKFRCCQYLLNNKIHNFMDVIFKHLLLNFIIELKKQFNTIIELKSNTFLLNIQVVIN